MDIGFASVENLIGGSADDKFLIGASGSVDGVVDGGSSDADADPQPVDTLDFSAVPPRSSCTCRAARRRSSTSSHRHRGRRPRPRYAAARVGHAECRDGDPGRRAGPGRPRGGSAARRVRRRARAGDGQDHDLDPDDNTKWLVFEVAAVAAPGGGGYRNIVVSLVDSSGASPFLDGDEVLLVFTPVDSSATGVGSFVSIDSVVGGSTASDSLTGPSTRSSAGRSPAPMPGRWPESPSRASSTWSERPATTTSSSFSRQAASPAP